MSENWDFDGEFRLTIGHRMFDNIKKFVLHVLAENIAQACTLLVGLAFKDASGISVFPLAPVEILVSGAKRL